MSIPGESDSRPKQRRSPRFPFDSLVRVAAPRLGEETPFWGRSTDLCREGIGMTVMTGRLIPEEVVGIEIPLPSANPVAVRASVRYCREARCPFPEYGAHPIGYLMYDSKGHMCVTLANPNPPHWLDPAKPTDAERALTHKGMEAYCGTYEVREKDGQVIHRPELAEWPHYLGSDQVRNFRIEGDRVILPVEETIPNGGWRRSRITWERVSHEEAGAASTR